MRRGSLTHFCIIVFWSEMTSCSLSQKNDTELGQTPTSQARPRDTDHLRPSNLAARALRSVEHTPSKFGHDRWLVWRQLGAVVKSCVRKARFVRCPGRLWNRTREARVFCGFQHHKGKTCFVFCFPIPQLSASHKRFSSFSKSTNAYKVATVPNVLLHEFQATAVQVPVRLLRTYLRCGFGRLGHIISLPTYYVILVVVYSTWKRVLFLKEMDNRTNVPTCMSDSLSLRPHPEQGGPAGGATVFPDDWISLSKHTRTPQ